MPMVTGVFAAKPRPETVVSDRATVKCRPRELVRFSTVVGTVAGSCRAAGRTGPAADEAAESPTVLSVTTVKVYAVPPAKPSTVHWVAPVVVQVLPPGWAVTVYPVTVPLPVPPGAVHETVADSTPAVAPSPVGTPGSVSSGMATTGTCRSVVLPSPSSPELFAPQQNTPR